jgi:glutaminyl-peptide cyclotransferase
MRIRIPPALVLAAAAIVCIGLCISGAQRAPGAPVYGYKVVHVYPHDRTSYTQGLEYRGGFLYEGTGLNGRSKLRKTEIETGKVLLEVPLDGSYFGEGITLIDRRVVQLTWQSQTGLVYDRESFHLLRTFTYPGEGWGLTNDGGNEIYMSDGSAEVRCWDGLTLLEKRRFTVREGDHPVALLNELEYVHGEIYANVYQTNRIVRFSPKNGHVAGWIDLTGLLPAADQADGAEVLNGIAYDSLGDRLFVTGKLWPKLFEIQLVRKS